MNQLNWDDLRLFLTIADEGSFRRAAGKLELGHTTLSRRIEALEGQLETRLFDRLPQGLALTESGEEVLRAAAPMGQQINDLQVRMFGRESGLKGKINLTIPDLLVNHVLLQPLMAFCERWPDIEVVIDDTFAVRDLTTKEADVAVRMTDNPHESLMGRRLGAYAEAVYASDAYLAAFQRDNLAAHRWIYPGGDYEFRFAIEEAFRSEQPPQRLVTLPDPDAQVAAAIRGAGIATLPCVMADDEPALRRISPPSRRRDIWLLSHPDSRGNERMRLFREFLVDTFTANAPRLVGETQSEHEI